MGKSDCMSNDFVNKWRGNIWKNVLDKGNKDDIDGACSF